MPVEIINYYSSPLHIRDHTRSASVRKFWWCKLDISHIKCLDLPRVFSFIPIRFQNSEIDDHVKLVRINWRLRFLGERKLHSLFIGVVPHFFADNVTEHEL